MRPSILTRRSVGCLFLAVLPAGLAIAGGDGQPVDLLFADRWNQGYQRLADLDGDGSYNGVGEVSFLVDPSFTDVAGQIQARHENGVLAVYWFEELQDLIYRGEDLNGDSFIDESEIRLFRDTGALDGDSWAQSLALTDDGAVWWSAALVIANPVNGIIRMEDLNGNGVIDGTDEFVTMLDATGLVEIEADDDGLLVPITGWDLTEMAAVGNGVIASSTDNDTVQIRVEDLNGDGDATDDGETILLLNATGQQDFIPQNPDFESGMFPSMLTEAGSYAAFRMLSSAIEDGERAFYFGYGSRPGSAYGVNEDGEAIHYLIYRGVDANGDGDVNDAGEVTLFFNGDPGIGMPDYGILRQIEAADGALYVVSLIPFPILFPGPDGNTWVHRYEDLNGDGDAMDEGEQQYAVFALQSSGSIDEGFPILSDFGAVVCDPYDLTAITPLGGEPATPGDIDGNGTVDGADLAILLGAWGTKDADADLDGDGTVSGADLAILLGNWSAP